MNERNVEIQKMLKAEGLYKGKLDGIIGPVTRRALELHNKQQYQPLPRERPGPPEPLQGDVTTGVGGPGAEATMQLPLNEESSDAGPDSETSESLPVNPASAEWIRSGINAIFGPETIQPPPQAPSYQPNFAGAADYPPNFSQDFAAGPSPMDSGALQEAIQQSLGQLLSQAVPRR